MKGGALGITIYLGALLGLLLSVIGGVGLDGKPLPAWLIWVAGSGASAVIVGWVLSMVDILYIGKDAPGATTETQGARRVGS